MLNNQNNYLIDLLSSAGDALSNLYLVTFRGNFLDSVSNQLQVRADSFTPPVSSTGTYTVRYLNNFVDRPQTKINLTRSFSLTFRVDSQMSVFKAILDQQGVTFNPAKSFTATDITTIRDEGRLFDITIEIVDEGISTEVIETTTLYVFKDCWISSITPISYDYNNSSPTTVSMTINFLIMEDPASGISGQTDSPNVSIGL